MASEGVFGITCLLQAEIEVLSLTLKVNFGITCGVFQSNIEVCQPSGKTIRLDWPSYFVTFLRDSIELYSKLEVMSNNTL